MRLEEIKDKVLQGGSLSKEEALFLYQEDLQALLQGAVEIRQAFCKNQFEFCTIVNAKSGSCSENCKFCAQSRHYSNNVAQYGLLDEKVLVEEAKRQEGKGIKYFSLVCAGRKLSKKELDELIHSIKAIKNAVSMGICVSPGLLTYEECKSLKDAGVKRLHNNLETSPRFFPSICTSHSFEDKVETIKAAQRAGLTVCSGGLIGLGESREDRVDLAFCLRELSITSSPINILDPIEGTPFGKREALPMDEILRTFAVFRYILPSSLIRLAGGRGLMKRGGEELIEAGVNAAITGDFLHTIGIDWQRDLSMAKNAGFRI